MEDSQAKLFSALPEELIYFASIFGPYPFDAYGVVLADANTQGAMENQTLSLYGKDVLSEDDW